MSRDAHAARRERERDLASVARYVTAHAGIDGLTLWTFMRTRLNGKDATVRVSRYRLADSLHWTGQQIVTALTRLSRARIIEPTSAAPSLHYRLLVIDDVPEDVRRWNR